MEVTKTNTPTTLQYFLTALLVLLACFALFLLDKDMYHISDLFKPVNLFALVFYFPPTFILSALLLNYFSKKQNTTNAIITSLVVGIPVSFTLVIFILISMMH